MNLLLHGLDAPQIDPGNSLRFKLTEIGERDRVDVILTNPPFGGEEEKGHPGQLPRGQADGRNRAALPATHHAEAAPPLPVGAATRSPTGPRRRGRAERHALRRRRVRPHQGGAAQAVQPAHHRPPAQRRVRALHQHPDQPAVLRPLRPDDGGLVLRTAAARRPQELHQDRSPSSSRNSRDCLDWWSKRSGGERARLESPAAELLANNCNLDRKNPRAKEDITHLPPEQLPP
jgi:type I restriction enzyme M protein